MNARSNKSRGWAIVLVALGVLALYGGAPWLLVLIPAAILIWLGAGSAWRTGRN